MTAISSSDNNNNSGTVGGHNSTDSASMYVNLAKASILTGQWNEADKWLNCASTAMATSKTFFLRQSMQQKFQNVDEVDDDDDAMGGGSGTRGNGKRASHGSSTGGGDNQHGNNKQQNSKRGRSVDLFLRHRRAELENELECKGPSYTLTFTPNTLSYYWTAVVLDCRSSGLPINTSSH